MREDEPGHHYIKTIAWRIK